MVVGTGSGEAYGTGVLVGQSGNDFAHFNLAFAFRDLKFAVQFELFGHLSVEVVETVYANHFQHLPDVIGRMGKIFHGNSG